jgi:hypothetical protein
MTHQRIRRSLYITATDHTSGTTDIGHFDDGHFDSFGEGVILRAKGSAPILWFPNQPVNQSHGRRNEGEHEGLHVWRRVVEQPWEEPSGAAQANATPLIVAEGVPFVRGEGLLHQG